MLVVVAAVVLAGGCGNEEGSADRPRLTVAAATSLKAALTAYGDDFAAARVRFSFGGSDELAAQIRQGVEPDVYAAANSALPAALHSESLVERPRVFAANRLVIAVPRGSEIESIDDLAAPGVDLAIGDADVPIGSYTRALLARLPGPQGRVIAANVRSEEPDVGGIVGKLTQGAADAGFTYVTDVAATRGVLRAIRLPASISPGVRYAAAVVPGGREPALAREFLDGLLAGAGTKALDAAGFERP